MSAHKKEISLLNVFCCMMVITIHLFSDAVTRLDVSSLKYPVAYLPWSFASFAVYGFLFLSALKLSMAKYGGYPAFLSRRFKKILIPYLIAVTVFWIAFHFFHGYGFSLRQAADYYLLGKIYSHFYYIVVLLQFYLLFPFWQWLTDRGEAPLVLPLAFLVMIVFRESLRVILSQVFPAYTLQYQDRFFMSYLAFWLAGCYAGRHYGAFTAILRKNAKGILLFFAVILWANLYFSYLSAARNIWHQTLNTLQFTYFAAAILAFYTLALRLAETPLPDNPLLVFLNEESYTIYLYHMLALIVANGLMEKAGITRVGLSFLFRAAFVSAATLTGCFFLRQIRRRIKKTARPAGS